MVPLEATLRIIFAAMGLVSFSVALVAGCGSSDSKQTERDNGGEGGDEPAAAGGGTSSPGNGGAGAHAMGAGGEGGVSGEATSTAGEGGLSGEATGTGGAAAGAGGAGMLVPVFQLFNTGVDDQGLPLAGGSIDPHYTLIESADPTFTGPDAIVPTSIAAGYWLAQSETSQWIAPSTDQSYPNPSPCNAAGTYVYRTTFSLSAGEAETFSITGGWAADNAGSDVVLNDVSLGITAASYTPLSPFTIASGFIAGTNTLDFEILDSGCPNGLRVELSASPQ
jgi:hypothetical protein